MKRRVSGSKVKQGKQESSHFITPTRSVAVGGFALFATIMLTRQLLIQPDISLFSALGRALVIVLPISLLMLTSQILFFLLALGFTGAVLFGSNGFPLTYMGAVLWILGGVSAFLLTLSYVARYIAPPFNLDINPTSYLGLILLLQQAFHEVLNLKKIPTHSARNIPDSFAKLNAGKIPNDQVYAIYVGARYRHSAGPGYTLLSAKDRIVEVYDLRLQERQQSVHITTRDGIPLDTKLRVEFSIAAPSAGSSTRLPYPYRPNAIRQLVYGTTVQTGEDEYTIHPYAQVLERAVFFLTQEVASRTLDDLLQVNTQEVYPLEMVTRSLHERLQEFVASKGLEIRSVKLTPLQLPKAVQEARLKAWQKSWQDPIKNRKLGKSIKLISADQAEAQLQVVKDLLANLDTFAKVDNGNLIQNEMLEQVRSVITDAAAEGLLKSLIPDLKTDK